MKARANRHQHRHFKTLILLVVSMTAGTFFLFWVDKITPANRRQVLRGRSAKNTASWSDITVRQERSAADAGFFHLQIDDSGRVFRKTDAWAAGPDDARSKGAIHVILTRRDPRVAPAQTQQNALRRVIQRLRSRFRIAESRIRPIRSRGHTLIAARPGDRS